MELSNREGRDRKGHQDRQLGLSSVLVKKTFPLQLHDLSHTAQGFSPSLCKQVVAPERAVCAEAATPPGKEAEMANARFLSSFPQLYNTWL